MTKLQRSALKLLMVRADGHPGMLRLGYERIRSVVDEGQLNQLRREFQGEMAPGLQAFEAALFRAVQHRSGRIAV